MTFRLLSILVMLVISSLSQAQSISCTERFQNFEPVSVSVDSTNRNVSDYGLTMAWYPDGDCLLVGNDEGLFAYDLQHPQDPLQIAVSEREINSVAVNQVDGAIAFGITGDNEAYLIDNDNIIFTLQMVSEAITAIAFSSDGQFLAVASSQGLSRYLLPLC